ncbi:phospholipase D family protein [Thauera sp. CAU 1555]|uniref:phospholipase D n=1 Tax=Thauera sedimentorum TaxID=2767595 RepID=A0ABR9B6V7_9RHOO|nr:phospholipase D family protein [Thauera sedimentorum]MBC9071161.1 phospholipase D family protein [Thauera sedimentorum]MBD8502080.1 phospholipase D family protein [Thauera sedimentorum]
MRVEVVLALVALGACAPAAAGERLPAQGSVEVVFSPADDPEAVLVELIGAARRSLQVQAYVFTSRKLATALVEAQRRGVVVEVLADAQMHKSGRNALPQLLEAGIPVAFETAYAAAHNKVLIVDAAGPGCAVATGSYNYTWSARNRNAENLIVLRDNCALAQLYLRNWQRHREAATELRSLPWEPRPGASPDG